MDKADVRVQNKIFRLFPQDPQEAMQLAVEQYTGLVWRTARGYLENPEDVKECVNDTFMEFYLHRENFDPERGRWRLISRLSPATGQSAYIERTKLTRLSLWRRWMTIWMKLQAWNGGWIWRRRWKR